jgi:acid phosphatase type 7
LEDEEEVKRTLLSAPGVAALLVSLVPAAPVHADTIASDSFSRTVAFGGGWGKADAGGSWTTSDNSRFGVNGSAGQLKLDQTDVARIARIGPSKSDVDITARFQSPSAAAGALFVVNLLARYTDSSNTYREKISWGTTGTLTLNITRVAGGSATDLAATKTVISPAQAGTWYDARFQVSGATLKAKVWADGGTEPDWQVTATDSTPLPAGVGGIRGYANGGNTNLPTLLFDDFSEQDATPFAPNDPFIMAAGDISCDPTSSLYNGGAGSSSACAQRATSQLINGSGAAAVLALGDDQYGCGGFQAFMQAYDPTWGLFKAITDPVPGNHEYVTSGGLDCDTTGQAGGYFQYFGGAAGQPGQGYYSFDVGSWHLIALNSNCSAVGGCGAGSPQETWLKADLAAHQSTCTLAFWHYPRFSSGLSGTSFVASTSAFWNDLAAGGADVVLNGHDHDYERFAPQTPGGQASGSGIREFIVGTGGKGHDNVVSERANSEVRNSTAFGVLRMTLHSSSYDWSFLPTPGGSFSDSGSTSCH